MHLVKEDRQTKIEHAVGHDLQEKHRLLEREAEVKDDESGEPRKHGRGDRTRIAPDEDKDEMGNEQERREDLVAQRKVELGNAEIVEDQRGPREEGQDRNKLDRQRTPP